MACTAIVVMLGRCAWAQQSPDVVAEFVGARPAAPAMEPMQAAEMQIHDLVNKERVKAGVSPLAPNNALVLAARLHSQEMVRLDYFEHDSPTPGNAKPWDRVERTGFKTSFVAENLFEAEGYKPKEIAVKTVREWMQSPVHRKNLLDPRCQQQGIGMFWKGDRVVITEVFSGPADAP